MTALQLLQVLVAWGSTIAHVQSREPSYLGLIEKTAHDPSAPNPKGNDVRVRVAFKQVGGEWVPAVGRTQTPDELAAAPLELSKTIKWQACRDGHSLGTVVSRRRPYELFSDKGLQGLQGQPPFVTAAQYERPFETFTGNGTIRPFVISTLADPCNVGLAARTASSADVARISMARLQEGEVLSRSRGWQINGWLIVELDIHTKDHRRRIEVVFMEGNEVRLNIPNAHVVDWISADGDAVPDVLLWAPGYNRDGYILVYGAFSKQAEFSWTYH